MPVAGDHLCVYSAEVINPVSELRAFFRASLITPVERDHWESDEALRRRRIVVTITIIIGALALGWALAIPPGDPFFYVASLVVATIWAGGAVASGRLHRGRAHTRNASTSSSVLQSLILGGMLLAVFLLGAVVVAQIPLLRGPVDDLLDHARYGSLTVVAVVTAISGIAEELFFRGALFAALPRRWQIIGSAGLYGASTVLSGVPLLVFAAISLGLLTGAQRRVTGGYLGPCVTHLTWSLGMLFLLPPVLNLV